MPYSTSTGMTCAHCGRPIAISAVFVGDLPYHYECTQSPYQHQRFFEQARYTPPSQDGCRLLLPLTEQRVREIVREEFRSATPPPRTPDTPTKG